MTLDANMVTYHDTKYKNSPILQKHVSLSQGSNVILEGIVDAQIQIMSLSLGSDVAGIFELNSGPDTIFSFQMSSVGGVIRQSGGRDLPLYCGSVNEDINIEITPAPTISDIYVQYRYRTSLV